MTATMVAPPIFDEGQRITISGIPWNSYMAISDALPEQSGVRLIFSDGRLTIVTTSRKHDWYSERLGSLVRAVAEGLGIVWEDSGSATYRREDQNAGAEGDQVFYFGENAERMIGPVNIDLSSQPPPDLAIEVEVSHSAQAALVTWGRLGVPEVWRFDPEAWSLGFWLRRDDGTYSPAPRGLAFPVLDVSAVLDVLKIADEIGASRWTSRLPAWVRETLLPRLGGQQADA